MTSPVRELTSSTEFIASVSQHVAVVRADREIVS